LQKNTDAIKVENHMNRVTEEVSTSVETAEVHMPSAFCVKNGEPEVSLLCVGLWSRYTEPPTPQFLNLRLRFLHKSSRIINNSKPTKTVNGITIRFITTM
jgi:hypothetical protein